MTDQEKESIRAVLSAALHNTEVVLSQLKSLVNPRDNSFPDFPMKEAITQVREAKEAIEVAIKEL